MEKSIYPHTHILSVRKRIFIFSANYLPNIGGAELALKELTDRIKDVDFDLITPRADKNLPAEEKIGNVAVFRVGNTLALKKFLLPKNLFPLSAFFKARKLVKKNGRYDAVLSLQASQGGGAAWLFKFFYRKIPFILNIQEGENLGEQGFLKNFFRNLIIKKADLIVVISNYLKQYFRDINKNARIAVIPNGIDPRSFQFLVPDPELKINLGIKNDERVIITVSRLTAKNGIEDLILSLPVVKSKIPDVKLIILGDGPLKESLKFKIKSLKLEESILIIGEILNQNVPRYLSVADVFVRPSLSEGLGSAFLEAMAAGVPVIGTSVGGIPDFLVDYETGLFCRTGDPASIAEKIILVLSDRELKERLVKKAKDLVFREYDWGILAKKFETIFNTI